MNRIISRLRVPMALTTTFLIGVGCNALTGVGGLDTSRIDDHGASTSSGAPSSSSGNGSSGADPDGSLIDAGSSSGGDADADGAVSCVVSEPDLLAYYPLDETSGTVAKDCSGNNVHGTVISAPPSGSWTAGKFGGGFVSTATAGCIDLGTPAALALEDKSFTVAAWVKPEALPTSSLISYYILGRTVLPDNAGWRVGSDNPSAWSIKLFDDTSKAVTVLASAGSQPLAVWTHVAATFAPSAQVKLYVNGVEVASSTLTTIGPDNQATLRIGCRADGTSFLRGTVDEVRIYGRAFTAPDIAALFAKQTL